MAKLDRSLGARIAVTALGILSLSVAGMFFQIYRMVLRAGKVAPTLLILSGVAFLVAASSLYGAWRLRPREAGEPEGERPAQPSDGSGAATPSEGEGRETE